MADTYAPPQIRTRRRRYVRAAADTYAPPRIRTRRRRYVRAAADTLKLRSGSYPPRQARPRQPLDRIRRGRHARANRSIVSAAAGTPAPTARSYPPRQARPRRPGPQISRTRRGRSRRPGTAVQNAPTPRTHDDDDVFALGYA